MIELGKKIAFHRKRLDLTQTELGEKLNVTAQAVSKWENGISDPDLGTLHRLSKIFGVSTDELIADDEAERETATAAEEQLSATEETRETESAEEAAPVVVPVVPISPQTSAPAQEPAPRVIVGYCNDCKKPIYQGDKYDVPYTRGLQSVVCEQCMRKRKESRQNAELAAEQRAFKRSMIWGGLTAALIIAITLTVTFCLSDYTMLWGLLIAVGAFTFVAQCFWGEWLFEFMCFFFRSFRMPGVIFTLDIDGIVWAITVKFLLGCLSALLSGILALFGVLLSLFLSLFTFPFAIAAERHKIMKLKNNIT